MLNPTAVEKGRYNAMEPASFEDGTSRHNSSAQTPTNASALSAGLLFTNPSFGKTVGSVLTKSNPRNELQGSLSSTKDFVDSGKSLRGRLRSSGYNRMARSRGALLSVTSMEGEDKNFFDRIDDIAATLKADASYDMNHPERGCFIIFNQKTFDLYNKKRKKDKHLETRNGTDVDAFRLKKAVEKLGFEYVKIIHNSKRSEILYCIESLSAADHSDYDSFGCAILTHGGKGDLLYARDKKMHLKDFTRPFGANRCPSLAGKPKLFFIQACRGMKLDKGGYITRTPEALDFVDGGQPSFRGDFVDGASVNELMDDLVMIPAEADFLIANSTVTEYYSWRNSKDGSYFMQSLCAIFNRYGGHMELIQMMRLVNRMIAYNFESSACHRDWDKKKQIPSICTRLTAEVFFKPKDPEQTRIDSQVASPLPDWQQQDCSRTGAEDRPPVRGIRRFLACVFCCQ